MKFIDFYNRASSDKKHTILALIPFKYKKRDYNKVYIYEGSQVREELSLEDPNLNKLISEYLKNSENNEIMLTSEGPFVLDVDAVADKSVLEVFNIKIPTIIEGITANKELPIGLRLLVTEGVLVPVEEEQIVTVKTWRLNENSSD